MIWRLDLNCLIGNEVGRCSHEKDTQINFRPFDLYYKFSRAL